jgi:hypothetical protein
MNIETDQGQETKRAQSRMLRLFGSAMIAVSAILVGRLVFYGITGLYIAEAALGGFAGKKFGAFALPGAVLAFLGWVSFVILKDDGAFHGEGSALLVIMFVGTIIFMISGSVAHLINKKLGSS